MPFLTQGNTNWKFLLIVVFLAAIVSGGILAYQYWWLPKQEVNNYACTQEAKLCSDGSYVSRTGLNCEFTECPIVIPDETAQIAVATDKLEYQREETVRITVKNNSNKSIWHFTSCGGTPFWGLQKFDDEEWQDLNISLPQPAAEGWLCVLILCEKEDPIELEPGLEINDEWYINFFCNFIDENGRLLDEAEMINIEEGTYRLVLTYGLDNKYLNKDTIYSNEFTVKTVTIGGIIKNPTDYENKIITIDGFFYGWSLPPNCNTEMTAMETRSDTLIFDGTGCLYMCGDLKVLYQEKELIPWDKANIGGRLKVSGVVTLIDGKPCIGEKK